MPPDPQELTRLIERLRGATARGILPDVSREHPGPFVATPPGATHTFETLLEQFTRELTALSGHVHRVSTAGDAAALVLDLLRSRQGQRILTWDAGPAAGADAGADRSWRAVSRELAREGVELVAPRLSRERQARGGELRALEPIPVGLTGARAALADTGSLVVTSGEARTRLASLMPPVHVAIVEPRDFHPSLSAFFAANPGVVEEASNLVVITGPSRTADIEMTLSWGVHGPKHVHAIVVGTD